MSGSLYLTRALHMPVSADGCAVKNSFGVIIATATDPMTATVLAEVVNLGHAAAIGRDQQQEIAERRRGKLLRRGLSGLEADIEARPHSPLLKGFAERVSRRLKKGDAA